MHGPRSTPAPTFAEQALHVMTKPIGPICNLDCEYCYYLHKEELYPSGEHWRMPDETLDSYIRQYIDSQPANAEEITFAWQGGEPTLLGVDFFHRVLELQRRYTPAGKKFVNALQTNGVLLDDEWCEFFQKNDFLIGISIDGPAELHDRFRYDKKGDPTFDAVHRGLKLLKRHGVEFNVLVAVNSHNGNHGRRVYTYLRDNGVQFLQFIPIIERRGVGVHGEREQMTETDHRQSQETPGNQHPHQHLVSSRSVGPEQFGNFLVDVFDEWLRRDVGRVFVQIFDQALSAWMGIEPGLCVFRRRCGRALALEHSGDLYSCDHFVEPEYKLGNIHELPIVELANSPAQMKFAADKETTLPRYCLDCEVRFVCNGECPKNRFIDTPDGQSGLNYLCAGYRKFFNHIDPTMKLMAEELRQNRPAANVMQRLNSQRKENKQHNQPLATQTQQPRTSSTSSHPGRNDLCPCGSGKKYKRCCLRDRTDSKQSR